MLTFLRTVAPFTFKSSHSPHQFSSPSPFAKHATFAAVVHDASQAHDHPLVAVCHIKEIKSLTTDIQLALLTHPTRDCDTENHTQNDAIARPDASSSSSLFPVYGPFDLLHRMQTGGFGSAWAARDQSTGRVLCLKVFRSSQDLNILRSARAELKVFRYMVKSKRGQKGRQFIIELNKSFLRNLDVFFVMELMSTDLGSYFSIAPERCRLHARRWMAQIALGIQSLHEMGIIHRDMKTENILIDARENIRIIDFGLAYLIPTGQCRKRKGPTEFLGTPPYMAPEVLRNEDLPTDLRKPYGMAVDWWALGCILFELESRDHELLFDTNEDVLAYVAWALNPCQQVYPRFEEFDFLVVDLLEGLLDIQSSTRYSLADLEKHDYFLRHDGTSEFDNATARALQRPVRPELVPQFAKGGRPIEVIVVENTNTAYDWTNLKWAHPAAI